MQTYGIRVFDVKKEVLDVRLADILDEIRNGFEFYWSILFLEGTLQEGKGKAMHPYKQKINQSKDGLEISWDNLCFIDKDFVQIFEISLLGCKSKTQLHRYENDKIMHQSCDMVIQLIDCAFWEVFSSDLALINRLQLKFRQTELIREL